MERVGGRKFVVAMVCVVAGSVLEFNKSGGISMAYATMIGAVVAAFGAANAWVTTNSMSNNPEGTTSTTTPVENPPPPPGPSYEDLQVIHQNMALLIDKVNQASETALKAGDLATSMGQQIQDVGKLAKAALKVNGQ